MLGRMLSAALAGGAGIFLLAGDAFAGTETIERPMFNGKRLDWCAGWTEDCGKPAADAFCKAQGYAEATDFKRDPHIGAASPTRVISTGAVCDLAHCDGFLEITCVKLPTVAPEKKAAPAKSATGTMDAKAPATDANGPQTDVADAKRDADQAPDNVDESTDAASAEPEADKTDKTDDAAKTASREPEPAPEKADTKDIRVVGAAAKSGDPDADAKQATDIDKTADVSEVEEKKNVATPVRLASTDPTPPASALAAAQPPVPTPKPVRVASAARAAPVLQAFPMPKFGGKRLDWCRGWKDTCGQSAADDFCKYKGFVRAAAFAPDMHIGHRQPTRQIATGMVCDQEMCDGFRIITCAR